jgi:alkylation response protein AidB-like acyl-CoA dehydrogenase
MGVLNGGRIGIASQALGIATGAYELALKYSRAQSFGKEIFKHQAISFKLADMATQIMAAKKMLCPALKRSGIDIAQSGAMAKLFASQTAMDTTIEAVQIHGGNGYVAEYHVERMMRDAKITQIYEGTSEIQRIVISRTLVPSI